MCYHTHYIFLSCGHSVSSPIPIHPAPPCPNRHKSPFSEGKASRHHRPFSFDPSVIASRASSLAEPFPAHTPWRLEQPFSTPDSAAPTPDEDALAGVHTDMGARSRQMSSIEENHKKIPESQYSQSHKGAGEVERGGKSRKYSSCGQVHIHPYCSYKLESLCLHCRRRRDTRLASFEVNAIRDSVQREPEFAAGRLGIGRRFRSLSHTHKEVIEGGEDGRSKAPGLSVITLPVSLLGRNMNFDEGKAREARAGIKEGEEQQQQTPWRLTLPRAEPPRMGWELAGMREGEWI